MNASQIYFTVDHLGNRSYFTMDKLGNKTLLPAQTPTPVSAPQLNVQQYWTYDPSNPAANSSGYVLVNAPHPTLPAFAPIQPTAMPTPSPLHPSLQALMSQPPQSSLNR